MSTATARPSANGTGGRSVLKPRGEGIAFDPREAGFVVKAMRDGRLIDLGVFPTKDLAEAALDAERRDQAVWREEDAARVERARAAKAAKGPKPADVQAEPLPRGVRYDPKSRKWVARILVGKVRKHLGSFATPALASQAYESAREAAYLSRGSGKPAKAKAKGKASKPGPKPRVKDVPLSSTSKGVAIPEALPPAPSSNPVAIAKAVLALAEILGPLDLAARKSALVMVGQLCGVN